jgi:hypothetical protein
MRQGDFSQLLNQARPTVIRDPLTGNPFPGNIIPTARLNQVPLRVQDKYIPSPNRGGPDELNNNLTILHPYAFDLYKVDYFSARVDHEFSANNHFFYRILNRWTPYVLPRTWPGLAWTRNRYAWHQVLSDTHVFSPSLILTSRFGWYRNKVGGRLRAVEGRRCGERTGNTGRELSRPQRDGFPRDEHHRLHDIESPAGRHGARRS